MRFVLLLIGSAVTSAVLMAWGFVFWSKLPWPKTEIRPLSEGDAIVEILEGANTTSGVYMHPYHPADQDDAAANEAFREQHRRGPLMQVFYRREGSEVMAPEVFAQGFGQFGAMGFLAGLLLWISGVRYYLGRVVFVLLVGLFAVVAVDLSAPIWFSHPWPYHLMTSAYDLGNALLAGIVMGVFVRPRRANAP